MKRKRRTRNRRKEEGGREHGRREKKKGKKNFLKISPYFSRHVNNCPMMFTIPIKNSSVSVSETEEKLS